MGSSTKSKEKVGSIVKIDLQDENIEKYKAILRAHRFSHKEGIDYEEAFALVAKYTSITTVLILASKMKWKLHQMDVKKKFLNGVIGK